MLDVLAPTTTPVGFFSPRGDSPYGCADMSGNVWEWTSTIYKDYPYREDDGREDIKARGHRVLRGGSFTYFREDARCERRYYNPSSNFYDGIGFRVCVSPITSL